MKKWITSTTSDKDIIVYAQDITCQETIEEYDGKDIKKAVIEKTAEGKIKSIHIDFVV